MPHYTDTAAAAAARTHDCNKQGEILKAVQRVVHGGWTPQQAYTMLARDIGDLNAVFREIGWSPVTVPSPVEFERHLNEFGPLYVRQPPAWLRKERRMAAAKTV